MAGGAPEPLAIVGTGCRLPGGIDDLDALWAALSAECDLVAGVPPGRFDPAWFLDRRGRRPGRTYTVEGGFLDDAAAFDAGFFGIAPREADRLDPQQRLMLELTREGLDDAGIDPRTLAGSDTAVFVGIYNGDYGVLQSRDPASMNAYSTAGRTLGNSANRVSYIFDLRGPSMAIDTACSSSLVALHAAGQALRAGECRVALAGGVNILVDPTGYVSLCQASMLSARGRCQAFSAGADGYVRGEGAGLVVLKSLSDALCDGDRVHALVLGTGVNTDGRTTGLSQPAVETQEALLREVHERAGVDPDELVYLEAHGTGTAVGDPVECEAIGRAIGMRRAPGNVLPIGSIKTNIGHLEAAAGLAGLLKGILVLRHGSIPPSLHGTPPNPAIGWRTLRIAPVTAACATREVRRPVVGVSSFGFGGVNAHALLAAPPAPQRPRRRFRAHSRTDRRAGHGLVPIVASARTPEAATEAALLLADRCDAASSSEELYDIGYTLWRRRGMHSHRIAVLAADPGSAAAALRETAEPVDGGASRTGTARPSADVVFAFGGTGTQWPAMAADLMEHNEVFGGFVRRIDRLMSRHADWSVVAEMAAPAGRSRLGTAEIGQPAIFAIQVGLVEALREYGIRPGAVVGHSVGEVAAAYASGALALEDAVRLSVERGRAQQVTAGEGRMAAVGLAAGEIAGELARYDGRLELAAVNSDRDVTIAGDPAALSDLGQRMAAKGVFFRPLDLDFAFHSRAMDAVEAPLTRDIAGIRPRRTGVAMVSTVTGEPVDGAELGPEYWWRNVRRPVLFGPAAGWLAGQGYGIFLELSPHPVLQTYLRRAGGGEAPQASVAATLGRGRAGETALRTAVAALMAAGARVDWEAYFPSPGRVVSLPGYPWRRERHWNGDPDWWAPRLDHPLLGGRTAALEPTWRAPLDPARVPWLTEHRVGGAAVMPATGFIEMALAAGRRVLDDRVEITALDLSRPLAVPAAGEAAPEVQVSLSDEDGLVRVASRSGARADWTLHARGRVRRLTAEPPPCEPGLGVQDAVHETGGEDHYSLMSRAGLDYGPMFRVIRATRAGGEVALGEYRYDLPHSGYEAHPALVDGALQTGLALLLAGRDDPEEPRAYLPVFAERVRLWHPPPATGFARVLRRSDAGPEAELDVTITDSAGRVAMEITGCRLRRLPGEEPPPRHLTVLRAASHAGPAGVPGPDLSPADVIAAAEPALARLRSDLGPERDRRAEFMSACHELVARFAERALRELVSGADQWSVEDLLRAGMRPAYSRLAHTLSDLAAVRAGGDPEPAFAEALLAFPEFAAELMLTGRCGRHLADVLRGRTAAVDLMFPQRDTQLAEHLYDSGPLAHAYNRMAQTIIREIVAAWPADRPLRILELGAGTGGLTAALLPVLPPERTRYVFTDVSAAFLTRAAARFAGYDFVEYKSLDLERDPVAQGFAESGFDLVAAANVLHVTSDLRRTLKRVAGLLDDRGLLLLDELLDVGPLIMVFGLLDGWWAFSDPPLRRDGPLISADEWCRLLPECGLSDAVPIRTGHEPEGFDHALFIARASASPSADEPGEGERAAAARGSWLIAAESDEDRALAGAMADELSGSVWTAGGLAPLPSEPAGAVNVVLVLGGEHATLDADPDRSTRRAVTAFAALRGAVDALRGLPSHVDRSLWLITRPTGAFPVPERPDYPGDATLWGAARCLANEEPGIRVRRVSFERGTRNLDDARRLAAELLAGDPEDEVVLTRNGRFAPRIVPVTPTVRTAREKPIRLNLSSPGRGFRLGWRPASPAGPGPDEVLIEVSAAGLNFRNVLKALGRLPADAAGHEDPGELVGFDCAGVVTEAGENVRVLRPGDRVYALAEQPIGSQVTIDRRFVARMPAGMEPPAAATLPVAFLSVRLALADVARLAPGETVLVHSAAGGVGLAAIQHARHAGAQVIATAGTEEKRDLLRLLGVEHVLDSRDLTFADEVMNITAGHGVDVVLNSLAGEALSRGVELLRPRGRFVELGKRDLYADRRLAMRALRDNVSFSSVDIKKATEQFPDALSTCFREVAELVEAGIYRPLPFRVHPATRVAEAFEQLGHSRHVGKLVMSFEAGWPVPDEEQAAPFRPDPDATYLVIGGIGGFGGAAARWLAERGARHLTLTGRRGPGSPEATETVEALRALGAEVTVRAADAADPGEMSAVVAAMDEAGTRLGGVLHAAMVQDDALIGDLSDERFLRALAPKQTGLAVLDQLTRDRRPDLFVAFSSVTASVGNPKQANYSAGNLFGEALIRARRARGVAGLAVAWGAIGDVGYLARHDEAEMIVGRWTHPMRAAAGLATMGDLLGRGADVVIVGSVDWDAARAVMPGLAAPRFSPVRSQDAAAAPAGLREAIVSSTGAEAEKAVRKAVTRLLAGVIQAPDEDVDLHRDLAEFGLDSLMMAELQAAIWRNLGCDVPVMVLGSGVTVAELSSRVLALLRSSTRP